MNGKPAQPCAGPTDSERQTAVARLLESRQLHRAPRLRQLLECLAKGALGATPETVKEHSIGVSVFGRRADYNPSDDNIVRVSIRQLRAKMQEYYESDGRDDEWVVVIPKGKYVLSFEPRLGPGPALPGDSQPRAARFRIAPWLPWIISGILFCTSAGLWLKLRTAPPGSPSPQEGSLLTLLAPAAGQKLTVVVEDSGVQEYHRLTGRKVELNDYAGLAFLNSENLPAEIPRDSPLHRFLQWSEATEFWSFPVLLEIVRGVPPAVLSVRHPRSLTMRDFQADNSLLLGGPFANPWVQLFDQDLNFQIEPRTGQTGTHIRNRSPVPGERDVYVTANPGSPGQNCYARVAYLPNLTGRGRILLAGGPHRASSEAAARFIATPDALRQALRISHARTADQLPWFEMLIEATAVGSAPQTMRLLGFRQVSVNHRQPVQKTR